MFDVICALYTFHQHIIDVYFVDHSLESDTSILESKGHHLAAVDSLISGEAYLVFVRWVHLDLIVPKIGIHKAKELVACRRPY